MERYEKIECKHCGHKSYFGLALMWHCWKVHHEKFTKRDIKFFIKYGIIGTTFLNILSIILFTIRCIILLICFPFHYIFELLS